MVPYSVLTVHAGIASSPSPASPPSTPPHRIPSRISRHGPLPSPSSSPEGWFRSGQPPRNPQKASQSPEGESKSAPGSTPPRPFCSLAGRAVVHLVAAEHRSCAGCRPGCWGELAAAWPALLLSRKHSLAPPPACHTGSSWGPSGLDLRLPSCRENLEQVRCPWDPLALPFALLHYLHREPGQRPSPTLYSLSTQQRKC